MYINISKLILTKVGNVDLTSDVGGDRDGVDSYLATIDGDVDSKRKELINL